MNKEPSVNFDYNAADPLAAPSDEEIKVALETLSRIVDVLLNPAGYGRLPTARKVGLRAYALALAIKHHATEGESMRGLSRKIRHGITRSNISAASKELEAITGKTMLTCGR